MLGRFAFHHPMNALIDQLFYQNEHAIASREELSPTIGLCRRSIKARLSIARCAFINLYHGERYATQWRRLLSENAAKKGRSVWCAEILENRLRK